MCSSTMRFVSVSDNNTIRERSNVMQWSQKNVGGAASRRPQELNEFVELQFSVLVGVMLSNESLDFVVAETEAVEGRLHFCQRHRTALVAVQFVKHLPNMVDPAFNKT